MGRTFVNEQDWPFPWPPPTPTPGNTNKGAGERGGAANGALPGTVIPVVYGRQRIKASLIYADAWAMGYRADFWYVISEGPITSIEGAWWGEGDLMPLISNGLATCALQLFPGVAAESMDGYFNSRSTNVSRMPRTAHAWLYFNDGIHSGYPDWRQVAPYGKEGAEAHMNDVWFEVKGLKVYDPRDDNTVTGTPTGSGLQRANDPTTWAYSNNPALCIRDFLCDPVHGCGLGHASGYVNDLNFIDAANACDSLGFTLNIALTSEGDATSWLDQMRLVCNGTVYVDNGKYCLFIDQQQSTVIADFTTVGPTANCRQVNYLPIAQRDQPTRVIIEYPHASHLYAQDTVTCDNPGVALGTVPVREARYKADGIITEGQAWKIGSYIINKASFPLRVDFLASYVAHKLTVGSLITLTTDEGLSAQKFVVDALEEQEGSGETKVTARIYFDSIFSWTIVTGDTPPSTSLPETNANPPDVTVVGVSPMADSPYGTAAHVGKTAVTTNTATQTVVSHYVTVDYTIPTVFPWAHELVIRWATGAGYNTATWASMSANELVVPLTGNTDPWADSGYTFWLPLLVGETDGEVFYPNGVSSGNLASGGGWRVIARVRSVTGNLSTGVTIDAMAYSSSSSAPDIGANVVAKPLGFIATTLPSLSGAGEAKLAMDSATNTMKISVNGGAYTTLGGGGAPTRIYVGSGITGTVDDANTTFTTSVNASVATFWLAVVDGVIDFAATWSGTTLTPSSAPHSSVSLIYWS